MWWLKTAHVLLLHHAEHAEHHHPVCEAAHDPNQAHIHDERWAKEDCVLCAFVVSVPEPFSQPLLADVHAKLPDHSPAIFYAAPVFSRQVCDAAMRRGPPFFATI